MKTTTMRRILAIGMSLIIVSATSLALAANPVSVEVEETKAEIHYAAMDATGVVRLTNPDPSNYLSVRKGPGTNYNRIHKLKQGWTVKIIGEEGGWYKIRLDSGVEGYVSKQYVELLSSSSRFTGVVKTSNPANRLNVRAKATASSASLGKLAYGTQVSIVGESGNFYQISEPVSGYVSKNYITTSSTSSSSRFTGFVKTSNPANRLNVRAKATASSASVSKLAYGTQVSIVGESGNFYQISEPVSGYVSKNYITTSSTSSSSTPSNSATTMTNALYQINTNSSYITCGFDGYRSTSGRHEGIDFKRSLNANVYSLTDGVVTYVKYGSVGSKGLSTIAIYNSDKNITVVYLHSHPVSLYVGQHINRGQLIANESWRGVSSQKSAHTHVELRPGKNTHAAKSVGDKKLDNPNPTSYWQSLGYRVF